MKRRWVGAAALLTGALALAGCSTDTYDTALPQQVAATTAATPTTYSPAAEREFLENMRWSEIFRYSPDAHVIELGRTVCYAFERGMSPSEVRSVMATNAGVERHDAIYTMATAVADLCPEYGVLMMGRR